MTEVIHFLDRSIRYDVIKRSGGRCEFCNLRKGTQVHHRVYSWDKISHLMLVCRPCHRVIHGLHGGIVVAEGSLADRGDNGYGCLWEKWGL